MLLLLGFKMDLQHGHSGVAGRDPGLRPESTAASSLKAQWKLRNQWRIPQC